MVIDKSKLAELGPGRKPNREQVILVVDDEPLILASMSMMLEEEYEVIKASCGEAAMQLLRDAGLAARICLIISDQRMPGMSGVELLKQAAPLAPRAIRMIVTGYMDFLDIVSGINEAHIHFYLSKAQEFDEFREAVRRAVAMYEEGLEPYRRIETLEKRLAELEESDSSRA